MSLACWGDQLHWVVMLQRGKTAYAGFKESWRLVQKELQDLLTCVQVSFWTTVSSAWKWNWEKQPCRLSKNWGKATCRTWGHSSLNKGTINGLILSEYLNVAHRMLYVRSCSLAHIAVLLDINSYIIETNRYMMRFLEKFFKRTRPNY